MKEKGIPDIVKELVITKIEANMPAHLQLSIGSYGMLSKEKMIEHIEKGDEIGKHIVKSHLSFLRAIASGELAKYLAAIEDE